MTSNQIEHLNRARQIRIDNINKTFTERFCSKVNKEGPVPPHRPELGPCWIWTGSLNGSGYGQVKRRNRALMCSHVAFEECFGPIPDRLNVLHHCDNPPCVNPSHLFLGTCIDNINDCIAKNRRRYRHGDVPKRKGELNGRAKLTEALVGELRQMDWSKYGSRSKKARELGIAVGNLTALLQRRTWKHIP